MRQGEAERKAQRVRNPRDKWGLRLGSPYIQPAAASDSADKLLMHTEKRTDRRLDRTAGMRHKRRRRFPLQPGRILRIVENLALPPSTSKLLLAVALLPSGVQRHI